MLFLPSLVADGGPQLQLGAVRQRAAAAADHHSQAGLLQNLAVVVIGVAHGPAAQVPLRVLVLTAVNVPHVAVRPFLESVVLFNVLCQSQKGPLLHRRTIKARRPPVFIHLIY